MVLFYRLLRSKIATVMLLGILLLVAYQTTILLYKGYTTESDVKELQSRVDELTDKRERLLALQALLQSDFFAEREARLKLGLQKQGEYVVILPPIKDTGDIAHNDLESRSDSSDQEVSQGETKNTTLWWNYFFTKQ